MEERGGDAPDSLHRPQGGSEQAQHAVREGFGFLGGPAVEAAGPLVGPGADEPNQLLVGQLERLGCCRSRELPLVFGLERGPGGHGLAVTLLKGSISTQDRLPGVSHELEHGLRVGEDAVGALQGGVRLEVGVVGALR